MGALTESGPNEGRSPRPPRTATQFFRKYFLEGQHMDESRQSPMAPDAGRWERFHGRHRKYFAILIPFLLIQSLWWTTALRHGWLSLYPTRWQLPVTMILGAMIAGMTSEGGGAVAFPVMTLLLHIDPDTARDFAIMMQSVGMSAALFVVVYMGILVEKRAIVFGTLGSVPGMIFGLTWLDPLLGGPEKKMFFVSVWSSFACALYLLNSEQKRKTYPTIPEFCAWKAVVLVATGFVGGIFTAFAGSGVDICTFSVITLLFRVTEKTATPTTVVLMGLNSLVAFYWRAVIEGGITTLAWEYLAVSVPVAVTFAPLGSFLGSHFHRLVLAFLIYILEGLSVVGFLVTRPPLRLVLIGAAIVGVGFAFFSILSRIGRRLMRGVEGRRADGGHSQRSDSAITLEGAQ